MNTANFHSIIARRITTKMFFLYFSIYLFVLLLLIAILSPKLYEKENKEAQNALKLVANEYNNVQTQLTTYMDSLYLFENLTHCVNAYRTAPSDGLRSQICLELGNFKQLSTSISTVTLESMEQDFFEDYFFNTVDKQQYLHESSAYMNLFHYKQGSCYTHSAPGFFTSSADIQYPIMTYSSIVYFDGTPYIATIFYNVQPLVEQSESILESFMDSYLILDRHTNIIYSTQPEWDFNQTSHLFNYNKLQDNLPTFGGVYYYARIPASSWYVFSFSPSDKLLSNLFAILGIITLLYLISPILYCGFLIPIMQKTLSPLKLLSDAMKSYSMGDVVQLDIHTEDEIQDLNDSFNQMLRQISEQIQNIKKQEHENAVVNYKLLATQIDPHFIYNSMNIINILARQGKNENIIEINSALIRILQDRLNSKITIYNSIENEIDTLLQYETIMHYRYSDQIKLHYDVEEDLYDKTIPKNILQPLVENAFFHGFNNKAENIEGNIDVMIYGSDNDIVIEVSDNGRGMTEERIQQVLTTRHHLYDDNKPHIGIENIQQRLAYIYKNRYSMKIQSSLGYGTTVVIIIPREIES